MREFKDSISGDHKDDQELEASAEEAKTEPEKSASSDS
jgi:hypothetical protein